MTYQCGYQLISTTLQEKKIQYCKPTAYFIGFMLTGFKSIYFNKIKQQSKYIRLAVS